MRKTLLTFGIIFSLISGSFAQESQWGVSFTPAMVPAVSLRPGWQLGAEYRFGDRWSVLNEFAVRSRYKVDTLHSNVQYFRIKPEIRYALSDQELGKHFYTGLQFSYAFRKWKDLNGGSYFEEALYEDSAIAYSSASVNSPIFTTSAQIGVIAGIGDHFGFDLFMGMGVRVINTTYSDVQNPTKDYSIRPNCMIFFSPDPAHWVNGTITRYHFNIGFRFLYRF